MSLNITWEFEDSIRTAILSGRIDSRNALLFKETISAGIAESDIALILNFAHIEYISSAGLRIVLQLAKIYRGNKRFAICGLSTEVREVFEISGFDQIITIYGKLDQAKEGVKA
ncbi:MAG: STAS domain-containing protein [Bacteroidetes bacterium]|nr:STAS domain-containing protein [Bacteroidota bacterium]MCY4204215.1 STAS domain-containing protein [Bacteroidota bacterium]